MSLSSYLRELIHVDASRPAMTEVLRRADQMLDDFADLPVVRYPMQLYQRRVSALRDNFTAYDAFYVALAESLGMPLLTDDPKIREGAGAIRSYRGVVLTSSSASPAPSSSRSLIGNAGWSVWHAQRLP